jgi:oligoribonuclease NrnB/cAMP/cGMP phosphodiesterase (DHH superfamily)
MKCFYHSADLDGHCSGYLVKRANPGCEMFGINYGDAIPWGAVEDGETVYMVDFCLQPFDDMVRLGRACNLLWVDHHKTSIEEAERFGFNPPGLRKVGLAGCELTDLYIGGNPDGPAMRAVPLFVWLLGRYDVWDLNADSRVLPFQYGCRQYETRPEKAMDFWCELFDTERVQQIVNEGEIILRYQDSQNSKYAGAFSFETAIDGMPVVAINRGLGNSQLFDSAYDPEKHKAMVAFAYKRGLWTVSIYSTHDDVDAGEIAKKRGGGGHKGAAGFQCEDIGWLLK